jgi:protein associated with RNAse G/E
MSSTKLIAIQKREKNVWKPGEVITWRGIFRNRIWHAMPTFVVKDTLQELVLTILPGALCKVEKDYNKGKNGRRIWDFKDTDWKLDDFIWHTNRLLFILEPEKYFSTNLFWNHEKNRFIGYYVNFQYPYRRTHCGIDALDLELDLDIAPDLSFTWKDMDDYQKAIACGLISPECIQGIETAKPKVLERLEKRQYPFDGSWLDWIPDPSWAPPTLPRNWDRVQL